MYDAIVVLGLAACSATKEEDGTYFDGTELYNEMMNVTFSGTTGNVRLGITGSRDPLTAMFSVKNFLADEPVDGMVSFSAERTHVQRNGVWEEKQPFIYNDGSTTPPSDTPTSEVDYNYIGTGLRAGGLVLCAIILALSLVSYPFMFLNRCSASMIQKKSNCNFLFLFVGASRFRMGSKGRSWT